MPSRLAWTLVTLATLAVNLAFAVPTPWDKNNLNAYSGAAGQAPGGGVVDNAPNDNSLYEGVAGARPLVNVASQNAGKGGQANSGGAMVDRGSEHLHGHEKLPQADNGDSFSGAGGNAGGGAFMGHAGIINLLGDNAADAGTANSGSSNVLEGLPLEL